ncbi:MAG TPA: TPM domain-containing protein [Polyangiaceae bacterium]|nr:TPM domain-containing protein [Polyangiaceae bacterium]
MALLPESDVRRIEATIAKIEAEVDAELVVAVVPRSATHAELRGAAALAITVAAALVAFHYLPRSLDPFVLALELPSFAALFAVLGRPWFQRHLIRARDADETVRAAALRTFAERGVHRTANRTGILVFVSEVERRAVILGDSGVHDVVGDEGWNGHVRTLVSRIGEGRTGDGIVEVLEGLGSALSTRFPAPADKPNELPNAVLRS